VHVAGGALEEDLDLAGEGLAGHLEVDIGARTLHRHRVRQPVQQLPHLEAAPVGHQTAAAERHEIPAVEPHPQRRRHADQLYLFHRQIAEVEVAGAALDAQEELRRRRR
jgi:hypothetical protein